MSRRTVFRGINLCAIKGARIECIAQSGDRLFVGTLEGQLLQYQLVCTNESTPTRPANYQTRQISNESIGRRRIEQMEIIGDTGRLVVLGGECVPSSALIDTVASANLCAPFRRAGLAP